MRSPIRWVGGKQRLVDALSVRVPPDVRTYHEPFFGGGSLFFALRPKRARISDLNAELISFYVMVRDRLPDTLKAFDELAGPWNAAASVNDKKRAYHEVRALDRQQGWIDSDRTLRAARFLYLNKSAFNGLWRVNSSNQHNVPYGHPRSLELDVVGLQQASEALANADIVHQAFDAACLACEPGDFVYFDPPYVPTSATAGFTMYTELGFCDASQVKLRDECDRLNSAGVRFVLSNADVPRTRELYQRYSIEAISVRRSVSAKAASRGNVDEVVITNYTKDVICSTTTT